MSTKRLLPNNPLSLTTTNKHAPGLAAWLPVLVGVAPTATLGLEPRLSLN
jgi:hypothetical protein